MAKYKKVPIQLHEVKDMEAPTEQDIRYILRAADEIISTAGRTMLVKILKGSKEKRLLEFGLEQCPSYGCFKSRKKEEVEKMVDWMIWQGYLRIIYNGKGRLPMIVFTDKGWTKYKPIYAEELIGEILALDVGDMEAMVNELQRVNREVVDTILDMIQTHRMTGTIQFLEYWAPRTYKKVGKRIREVMNYFANEGQ